jgi:hypothetical protein
MTRETTNKVIAQRIFCIKGQDEEVIATCLKVPAVLGGHNGRSASTWIVNNQTTTRFCTQVFILTETGASHAVPVVVL